jgi:hypothetical protein
MKATTFWWNQGELQCFITKRDILEMSRRYGRLIIASLNTLALALSAYVCGLLYISFTNVVCIHSIRSRFCMLVSVLLLLSGTSLAIGSRVTEFSFCLFLRPTLMRLVPLCASPFLSPGLPSSTSDCKPLPRCPSCCFSSFFSDRHSVSLHTTSDILCSTVRRQVSSTSFPSPSVAVCNV